MSRIIYYLASIGVILGCTSVILFLNTTPLVDKTGYTILTQATGITGLTSLIMIFFGTVFNALRHHHAPYDIHELTEKQIKTVEKSFPNPDKELSRVITKDKKPVAYILVTKIDGTIIAKPKLIDANYKDVGAIIRDNIYDTAAYLDQDIILKTTNKKFFRDVGFMNYKNPHILAASCPKTLKLLIKNRFEKSFKIYARTFRKKKQSKLEFKRSKHNLTKKIHKENVNTMKILYKELVYRNSFEGITKSQTETRFYDFIKEATETAFESSVKTYFS